MWFLGNTSDGIASSRKAGEPTPFYISILRSLNETVGPNMPERRDESSSIRRNSSSSGTISPTFPPPNLNPDGTGAPAQLLTFLIQQPLRLFDRGLPTEHYGFYTFFDKSIYVKSVTPLNNTTAAEGEVPSDKNGGSLETEANFVVSWGQTRYKVEIWTRMGNSSKLVSENSVKGDNSTRPGTMPYPVTVTLDTHGGDYLRKGTFFYKVDDRQHIDTSDPKIIVNNIGVDAPRINPGTDQNPSFGGIDGGTGGCRCTYTNFVGLSS
jgi:hypothetical protein